MLLARRDPQLVLTLATAVPIVAIESAGDPLGRLPAAIVALSFVAFDAAAAALAHPPRWLASVRSAATVLLVVAANVAVDGGGQWPLIALLIPVAALAAARGGLGGGSIVVAAIAITLALPLWPGTRPEVGDRTLALAVVELTVAIITRRLVTSLERSVARARTAHRGERRRSRGLAAVEEVGRLLARDGPTKETLDRMMGLLETTFGFRYPSVYFWDGVSLHLAAQRNYRNPIEWFTPEAGVLGRVMRTRQPAFVPNVASDPDYRSADPAVTGEISVPMLNGDEVLGIVNVESDAPRPLDRDDYSTMLIVADRLAAAIALGRERQKLRERTGLLDRLTAFTMSLNATLDPATIHAEVAGAAALVVDAALVLLVVLDRETGEYRIAEASGEDVSVVGARVLPGEGVTGRALAERRLVTDDRLPRTSFPSEVQDVRLADVVAGMSAPMLLGGDVQGALTWLREDLTRPFTQQEQEIAVLLAAKVALAMANAELHEATRVAAVHDPLTGLHNRRFFDAALAHADAVRTRIPPEDRAARSAILFDLDRFGAVNKVHGHALGDRVLERFSEALRSRVRAGDLAARIGGDEFAVVLDGATLADARRVADEIRMAFAAAPLGSGDARVPVTVSAGVAELAQDEAEGHVLLARADVALRRAKRTGRDHVLTATR